MKSVLIAPCGMNCNLCAAHLRDENRCPGCRLIVHTDKVSIQRCYIRNCEKARKFCSARCDGYPCKRLKALDKRYRTKYSMSMIDNLNEISKSGLRSFVMQEKKKWEKGKSIYCVHNKRYYLMK